MSMAPSGSERGSFGSSFGFVLAAAGSAIGLGNIWRFPYTAGENGGGAFVLIYLGFVLLIGIPVLLAELSVGRASQRNPVGAFRALVPKSLWPLVGGLGVLTGFSILAFYSVVAGWTLEYALEALSGTFGGAFSPGDSEKLFGEIIAEPISASVYAGAFLILTGLIVRGGVSSGIERASKILMPLFFLILLILACWSLYLGGAELQGARFLFSPDFSKIKGSVVMDALGQALFSLSLGMGAMITYGSYLGKRENLLVAGVSVALFDTLIAILAGLIIFPALFALGGNPSGGPGLVFVVLPSVFGTMPAGGTFFGVAFYVLLAIAALTSTISLLEVVVAYVVDERGVGRERAVWGVIAGCFLLAVPSAASFGGVSFLSSLAFGKSFFDFQNIIFGTLSLSVGALLLCVFVGWAWGIDKGVAEIESGGRLPARQLFSFLVRYVCPVAVLAVLGFTVWGWFQS